MLLKLRRSEYCDLEKNLGYRFRKKKIIDEALTHRSYRFEHEDVEFDNQRMEFLGDAMLGAVIAAYMYEKFQDRPEGALTSFRSQIASGKTLGHIGKSLDIGKYLKIGKGEEASGGRKRTSNLADALEAVIGAAYLDGGLKAVEKIYKKVFLPYAENINGDIWADNPKGKLQEHCQRYWKQSPIYRIVSTKGPPHAMIFTVEVEIPDGQTALGGGRSKREAEIYAAMAILEKAKLSVSGEKNDLDSPVDV